MEERHVCCLSLTASFSVSRRLASKILPHLLGLHLPAPQFHKQVNVIGKVQEWSLKDTRFIPVPDCI